MSAFLAGIVTGALLVLGLAALLSLSDTHYSDRDFFDRDGEG